MSVIAVYGGSFDPPHLAHQLVTLLVLETVEVDELWWVPTYQHVFGKQLAPWSHRLQMCRLATRRFGAQVHVSEIEAELAGGANRTFDTLQAIRAARPGAQLRLVVGADILAESHAWYRWDDVCAIAPPIIVARSGFELGKHARDALPEVPPISSTVVRELLARGESATPLVSRAVMGYIEREEIYR